MIDAKLDRLENGSWSVMTWPDQQLCVNALSEQAGKDAFVSEYNARHGAEHPPDEFRFLGTILVTATVRPLGDGRWEAVAYPGEGVYRVTAAGERAVRELFIASWNQAHGTDYVDANFDFARG